MEASLTPAAGITTATNGTYVAIQPIGGTEPIAVEIVGKAFRASGAFTATMVIQYSADGSSFSTHSSHDLAGTSESKPFAIVAKIPYPFVRLNISAISSATIVARLRMA
jgi:hypothetical protein